MLRKSDLPYLLHIQEAIEKIELFTDHMEYDDFAENDLIASAVIRKLEIIGEASKNISEELKREHKEIPWRIMTDMRNFLIHEYFGIDVSAVWKTLQKDLPTLKTNIKNIIKT
ncbi:DUF86 domain-containing protein [bacterium]|nr:DUF86 domain-containing protein [bacterium]